MNDVNSVIKRIILFCLPFILILLSYIILDPFMILYSYEDYNKDFFVQKNLDFMAIEKYDKNSKKFNFDSFIFGGSTSLYFTPTIWKKFLNPSNEIFSFNVSTEHITGIWSKINYLISNNSNIRNALLIFDTRFTFGKFDNDVPIFRKHYKVYPTSMFTFHYKYFLNYLDMRFLVPFIHYKLSKKFYPYMDGVLIEKYYYFDPITNEYFNKGILDELKQDSINYYEKRKEYFGTPTGKFHQADPQITLEELNMLNDIKKIFGQNKTSFKIIISPAYNQISFNNKDLQILQTLFGIQNVFDFTGINEITENKSNFYDELHFKKYVGEKLLEIVYSDIR